MRENLLEAAFQCGLIATTTTSFVIKLKVKLNLQYDILIQRKKSVYSD